MDGVLQLVKNAVQLILEKVTLFYRTAPTGALQLTGVLGLAAVVVGYIQLRGNSSRSNNNTATTRGTPTPNPVSATPSSAVNEGSPSRSAPGNVQQALVTSKPGDPGVSLTERGRAVRQQLVGVKKVSLSTLGVLFREQEAKDLQEGAQLVEDAVELVKDICMVTDVYLITHVLDDVGEAVIIGALEATGLLGHTAGKVKPHKLLFCSTATGKVSIVRQLEPDLHIDADVSTIQDLKRFMPQLVHVCPAGSPDSAKGPNVGASPSLSQFFS